MLGVTAAECEAGRFRQLKPTDLTELEYGEQAAPAAG